MKIAVVGVTGMVGQEMLRVLEERKVPVTTLIPVASSRSIGKKIQFNKQDYAVIGMQEAIDLVPDIAIFSAGGSTSLKFAPEFAKVGTTVIDNSSAWRMSEAHKLIVPEINANTLTKEDKIIANPNCSTIQMVLALAPLHKKYGIKRLVISTYQSVTGTGKQAVEQMMQERAGEKVENPAYPHKIDMNILPHIDVFLEKDYTKEEMKMVNETHKILGDKNIQITATAVRIPVMGGHAESVNVEFENDFDINELRDVLKQTDGVLVVDNPKENQYPMPIDAHGKDEVFVGRLRRDHSQKNTLNMWIVADNLRKGAATNAVQIAEYLLKKEEVNA
jgi:aspartate-semialdehyde dehydrogenase